MYSPGRHYRDVPRGLADNLAWRAGVLKGAADERTRRGLIEVCRRDIIFWVNTFCWQMNPLKSGHELGPFVLYEAFQDEAILTILEWIERGESGLIEKSRAMGGTYLNMFAFDWLSTFHPNKKFLVISRSEMAVDKLGDTDSIFGKLDVTHHYMPQWLTGPILRRKMIYEYVRSGSVITGEASTGKAGVGGRATAILLDEFSQVKEDSEVRQRTASTSNCRIFNGTHLGLDTEFYRISQQPEIKKLQMHWTKHPDKIAGLYEYDPVRPTVPKIIDPTYEFPRDYQFVLDGSPTGGPFPGVRSPWYDWMCGQIGNTRGVAMDLDINPTGSVSQVFDPIVIADLKRRWAREPVFRGELEIDRDTARGAEFKARKDGRLLMWINQVPTGGPPPSKYVMGWDIALGTGATPSCGSIVDGRTGCKVAEYANSYISPDDLGAYAVALAWAFKDETGSPAKMAWEANGPGIRFGLKVIELGFRHIYYRTDDLRVSKKASVRPGWYPTPEGKGVLIMGYDAALKTGAFMNPSKLALEETLGFRRNIRGHVETGESVSRDDPSGSGVNHGDRVIADALACMLAKDVEKVRAREAADVIPYGSIAWRRAERALRELDVEQTG